MYSSFTPTVTKKTYIYCVFHMWKPSDCIETHEHVEKRPRITEKLCFTCLFDTFSYVKMWVFTTEVHVVPNSHGKHEFYLFFNM